jgi:hypothetical protein
MMRDEFEPEGELYGKGEECPACWMVPLNPRVRMLHDDTCQGLRS